MEHVAFNSHPSLRLDVISGSVLNGPTSLSPLIDLSREVEPQLRSVRHLDAMQRGQVITKPDPRLEKMVLALRVLDARSAGASLREIGLKILGGSFWPGEGEYLKSKTRRFVQMGYILREGGPAGIFSR